MVKTLIVTLGDPNGLGPELICRQLSGALPQGVEVLLAGPEEALVRQCGHLGLKPFWQRVDAKPGAPEPGVRLLVSEDQPPFVPAPGTPAPEGGLAAGLALETAIPLLLSGRAQALVTCPLNKAMLMAAGFDFPGHTEFLAGRSGLSSEDVCMHLFGPRLRVSLATTHPPLSKVPSLITKKRLLTCLRLTRAFLEAMGLSGPMAVCGLNPHAGESGCIGFEEAEAIEPAVELANAEGLEAVGPLPADTVFGRAWRGEFPAVLAMYHDQGLGPLKLVHFGQAVNVTLGLPFARTSPDHGTGYDLVDTGKADTGGFRAAWKAALAMIGEGAAEG